MDSLADSRDRHTVTSARVYLLFAASGAAALVYQIIWARWLGFIFGNTATSIAIVLASFMLGLALGSWWVGKWLQKIDNPMWLYALLELSIGVFALLFPLLEAAIGQLFQEITSSLTPYPMVVAIKSLLSFGLLVVPTTCMGATLPLLTEFIRRLPFTGRHWRVGILYGMNTMGAAIGTLAASFLLIELLGIRATTLLAASFNFLIAIVGIRYSKVAVPGAAPTTGVVGADNGQSRKVLGVVALCGATAMASEVLWTRALEVLIGNSTYTFGMILVVFLAGISFGSWLMAHLVDRLYAPARWLAIIPLTMALWTLVSIGLFGLLGGVLQDYRMVSVSVTTLLGHHLQGASLMLPLAMLSGALFPLASRVIDSTTSDASGHTVARVYAWNTVGGVLGSLVAGFWIASLLDYIAAVYLLVLAYALVALGAWHMLRFHESPRVTRSRTAVFMAAGLCPVLIALFALWGGGSWREHIRIAENVYDVIYNQPGIQGITTVLRREGELLGSLLLVNGAGMTAKVTDTKMMAHLPMGLHDNPEDTLVICFGMGTTYRSAMSHGGRVTVVELVAEVFDTFDLFYDDATDYLGHPSGELLVNDGRNYLAMTPRKFDVITVDPPPPIDSTGVNSLYSLEFIELARSRLKPGGIFAHWVPFPWAAAGVDGSRTFDMLVATFAEAFPHTLMIPGLNNVGVHLMGSMHPLDAAVAELPDRLQRPRVSADVNEWRQVPDVYYEQLVEIPALSDIPLVTDDRPRLEFNLIRLWRTDTKKLHPLLYW